MQYRIKGDELSNLLLENGISVPEFAVKEARLHSQTVYAAIRGEPVSKNTFGKLTLAMKRLKAVAGKVAS